MGEKPELLIGAYKGYFHSSVCVARRSGQDYLTEIRLKERYTRKKRDGGWFEEALSELVTALEHQTHAIGANADWGGLMSVRRASVPEPARLFSPVFNPRVRSFTHHKAHALGAAETSPFERSLIIVHDGVGNTPFAFGAQSREILFFPPPFRAQGDECFPAESLSVYVQDGPQVRCVHKFWQRCAATQIRNQKYVSDGIGVLFDTVANYVFDSLHEAGKLMGLAAYGVASELNDRRAFLDGLDWSQAFPGGGKAEWERSNRFEERANLAASVQQHYEDWLLGFLRKLRSRFPEHGNLILAGGCALNCQANMKAFEAGFFERIHVPPFPGDESIGLGIVRGLKNELGLPWSPVPYEKQTAAYGPVDSAPGSEEIVELFREFQVSRPKNLCAEAARLLHGGAILGWFDGRSEAGPRALGQRSILAAPAPVEIRERLNARIKLRESFRPYGCVCAHETAHDLFEVPRGFESPFMSFAPRVRGIFREALSAVTHRDGTSRIQTLRQEQNPKLYRLLRVFEEHAGTACLLNTSMNVMGEPLVETLADCRDFLARTPIDGMVIGDFIIRKAATGALQ